MPLAVYLYCGPEPWRLFLHCAYFPVLVIFVSWVLIRWKRCLSIVAVALGFFSGFMIRNEMAGDLAESDAIHKISPKAYIEPYFDEYVAAGWFAIVSPFIMMLIFYLVERKNWSRVSSHK